MTNIKRRLRNLEAILTDPAGLVPNTRKWLEYWDRQYSLYLSGQDQNAIRQSSIEAYRAVMKYAEENTASLARRSIEENNARENDSQTA